MSNIDKIFALGDLRRILMAEKLKSGRHIEGHLSEFRHDFSPANNKIWAVKDARLSEHYATISQVINIIDKEIRRYE